MGLLVPHTAYIIPCLVRWAHFPGRKGFEVKDQVVLDHGPFMESSEAVAPQPAFSLMEQLWLGRWLSFRESLLLSLEGDSVQEANRAYQL
jgi:hypothetical protein